jgi:hypothetical protein
LSTRSRDERKHEPKAKKSVTETLLRDMQGMVARQLAAF